MDELLKQALETMEARAKNTAWSESDIIVYALCKICVRLESIDEKLTTLLDKSNENHSHRGD